MTPENSWWTRAAVWLGATFGVISLTSVILFVGMALDFEFPFTLTISRAAHAHTADGADATAVIARTLGVSRSAVRWHRCGTCMDFEQGYPRGCVRVSASVVPGKNYIFAFNPDSGLLYTVPWGIGGLQDGSAGDFPSIQAMPVRTTVP